MTSEIPGQPRSGSFSTLPDRGALERAIAPWWQGGGSAVVLVDVLRKEAATLAEARAIAEDCGRVADQGYRITADLVTRKLGDLRSSMKRHSDIQDGERQIGSPTWLRRAREKSAASWEQFFPGEPMPSDPEEADRRYSAMIRAQRVHIATTVGEGRKKAREEVRSKHTGTYAREPEGSTTQEVLE